MSNHNKRWVVMAVVVAAGLMLAVGTAWANNMVVTNVTVSVRNTNTAYVKFDISWENSWRYTNINHDAAWVFFKVLPETGTDWKHVILEGSGTNPTDYATGTGTPIEIIVPTDHVGLFVRRSEEGFGTTSVQNVKAVWNFTSNSLAQTEKVRMQALAVEMVYVATGSFYVGSGGASGPEFYKYPTVTDVYAITNEAYAITVSAAADNLYYAASTYGGDRGSPIPAAFPKGYAAFYCMKYEITQGQYRDFLNTLTRAQQLNRTATNQADWFAMTANAAIQARNIIRCPSNIPAAPEPIVFGCDGNNNKVFNETNDAMDRACNYLSWADGCAFADWAGLRPMTELEYEKACRGPLAPVAGEYAWGNVNISMTTAIVNDGAGTDTATGGNCNYNGCQPKGPYRAGIYATGGSSREAAGASYWGIMELTGSVKDWEVTVGHATGRAFTGLHGDGELVASGAADTIGDANVSAWPPKTAGGSGYRGADWSNAAEGVSSRGVAAGGASNRHEQYGGRAVRTAP